MSNPSEAALMDACRTLFGDGPLLCRDFLSYLQPNGVKAAYRLKAKEAHPDRFAGSEPHIRKQQTAFFQEVNRAYDLLRSFFREREHGTGHPRSSGYTSQRQRHGGNPNGRNSCRIPERPLQFGHYLYHRGLISYQQLINALVWQRQQRPMLGELAVQVGWLRDEDTLAICRQREGYARFGERAIRMGKLSTGQVKALILHQRTMHKKIGQYFVEKEILSAEEVEHLAEKMKEHNVRVASRRPFYKKAL
ncbi:MAG: J domain-containing protein [Desulfuromonas sp.]|nr:MAG: J domain-containing protein [Desulfuromonas sp.]